MSTDNEEQLGKGGALRRLFDGMTETQREDCARMFEGDLAHSRDLFQRLEAARRKTPEKNAWEMKFATAGEHIANLERTYQRNLAESRAMAAQLTARVKAHGEEIRKDYEAIQAAATLGEDTPEKTP